YPPFIDNKLQAQLKGTSRRASVPSAESAIVMPADQISGGWDSKRRVGRRLSGGGGDSVSRAACRWRGDHSRMARLAHLHHQEDGANRLVTSECEPSTIFLKHLAAERDS